VITNAIIGALIGYEVAAVFLQRLPLISTILRRYPVWVRAGFVGALALVLADHLIWEILP
jgi:hypothetical protein